jgi:hypothetical protein
MTERDLLWQIPVAAQRSQCGHAIARRKQPVNHFWGLWPSGLCAEVRRFVGVLIVSLLEGNRDDGRDLRRLKMALISPRISILNLYRHSTSPGSR